jgi:hypothetical protein
VHVCAAQEVNRWRELNAECTFQPRIRPLPQGYGTAANSSSGGNSSAPFLQRVSKWQRDKTAAAAQREQDGDDKVQLFNIYCVYVCMYVCILEVVHVVVRYIRCQGAVVCTAAVQSFIVTIMCNINCNCLAHFLLFRAASSSDVIRSYQVQYCCDDTLTFECMYCQLCVLFVRVSGAVTVHFSASDRPKQQACNCSQRHISCINQCTTAPGSRRATASTYSTVH